MLEKNSYMPGLSRRQWLKTAITASTILSLPACSVMHGGAEYDYVLTLAPTPLEILPGTMTPTWTFNGEAPGTTLRVKQGQPVRILVRNRLTEPTTVHWHGIRLVNNADGVPYLTQPPIAEGTDYVYEFTCPDAGTFWYHPHFNSLKQLSHGLVGLLIVEEAEPVNFDADIALALKDWLLNDDGSFKAFSDPRAAARTGTLGNVVTINGKISPRLTVAAGANLRLRLANIDNTRVFTIACDHEATIIAKDGNPIAVPETLDEHAIGAGMRVDLALRVPNTPGEKIRLFDKKGRFAFDLCEIEVVTNAKAKQTPMPQLPLNPIPTPNIEQARRIPLVFEWAGALSPGHSDGSAHSIFWTINKRAWDHAGPHSLPEPLADIQLGSHVIFELHNATPHHHPIHLHGSTFTVLSSDKREITPFHTDTVLMSKYERMEVAIVADNPGNWMFHCHVIEHMKTGLMGYIRIA